MGDAVNGLVGCIRKVEVCRRPSVGDTAMRTYNSPKRCLQLCAEGSQVMDVDQ